MKPSRRKRKINRAPCRKEGVPCKDKAQGGIATFGSPENANKTWDEPEAENKGIGWGA